MADVTFSFIPPVFLKRYAGQFKDNKMEGVGIMVHNDATVYEGEFSKGHKHGLGLATEPGGWIFGEHSYEGKWKKGNYKGVLYADSCRYTCTGVSQQEFDNWCLQVGNVPARTGCRLGGSRHQVRSSCC